MRGFVKYLGCTWFSIFYPLDTSSHTEKAKNDRL